MSDLHTAHRAVHPAAHRGSDPAADPEAPVEAAALPEDEPLSCTQPTARKGLVARLVTAAIRAYQLLRVGRVSPCRFTPTCSQFAVEAVDRHGAGRGLMLTARRLGRCRPGGPSGYDPVPE